MYLKFLKNCSQWIIMAKCLIITIMIACKAFSNPEKREKYYMINLKTYEVMSREERKRTWNRAAQFYIFFANNYYAHECIVNKNELF